jgi:hypothetical protein
MALSTCHNTKKCEMPTSDQMNAILAAGRELPIFFDFFFVTTVILVCGNGSRKREIFISNSKREGIEKRKLIIIN